ncbi:MAG: HAMP domain-containing sensor histidine kinase [Minisyncoccia bacterium]
MIESLIAECAWGTDPYLIFSENVFSPLIYYSHLTPILVSLILGTYIFVANRRLLINKILFAITIILGIWLFLDLILWATDSIEMVMFAWSTVNMIEPFIYAGFVYLVTVFIINKDVSTRTKILISLPLLPGIFAATSQWNVAGFNLTNCDREVIEGPMTFYNYLIEIGYVCWIIGFGIWAWFSKTITTKKTQFIPLILVTLLLLLGFSFGNIVGSFSEDWALGQYGLFVIPISIGALSYLIIQFRLMAKSQIMVTQMLVIGLWIAVGSIFFIQNIRYVRWIVVLTLVFLGIIGYLLLKSFRVELEQRKQIEKLAKDLEGANKRLKELDQLKSEFLSVAAHQLRAPLTAIRGYTSLIEEGNFGATPDTMKEPLARIIDSARNMANSIEDYLDVSRIEQGRMKFESSKFDLTDLAQKVVDELGPVATRRKLTLSMQPAAEIFVTADIGKIKQVMTNLVDNAIKYTQAGSVTISVEKRDAVARLMVSDTGIGIPAEEIPNLFDKFTRARDANKVNTTGTGLGLYVARKLIEGHKGKVWVESDGTNKGSRFIFEIPAA